MCGGGACHLLETKVMEHDDVRVTDHPSIQPLSTAYFYTGPLEPITAVNRRGWFSYEETRLISSLSAQTSVF